MSDNDQAREHDTAPVIAPVTEVLSPAETADALWQSLLAERRYERSEIVEWTQDGPVHTGAYPTSTNSRDVAAELTAHLRAHPDLVSDPQWAGWLAEIDAETAAADTDAGQEPVGGRAGVAVQAGPDVVVGLECPECGEDAVEQRPDTLVPNEAQGMEIPSCAHLDGEPLCPVMGPRGYEPAQPQERLAETAAEHEADPLQSARAAVDAAVSEPIAEQDDHHDLARHLDADLANGATDTAGEAQS